MRRHRDAFRCNEQRKCEFSVTLLHSNTTQRKTWRAGKPSRLALSTLTTIMVKTETPMGQNPGIV